MKAIHAALTLLSLLALAACGTTSASSGDISGFSRPSIMGERFDLNAHLGKDVVLISFWTTYCEPCKVEMPFLQQYHDKYGARGFTVVSVSMDGPDSVAEVRPYVRRMGYTYPIVIDEDGSIAQRLNPVAAAPFAILVGRDGKVIQRFSGFKAGEAPMLEAAILAALVAGEPSELARASGEAPPAPVAPAAGEAAEDDSTP